MVTKTPRRLRAIHFRSPRRWRIVWRSFSLTTLAASLSYGHCHMDRESLSEILFRRVYHRNATVALSSAVSSQTDATRLQSKTHPAHTPSYRYKLCAQRTFGRLLVRTSQLETNSHCHTLSFADLWFVVCPFCRHTEDDRYKRAPICHTTDTSSLKFWFLKAPEFDNFWTTSPVPQNLTKFRLEGWKSVRNIGNSDSERTSNILGNTLFNWSNHAPNFPSIFTVFSENVHCLGYHR